MPGPVLAVGNALSADAIQKDAITTLQAYAFAEVKNASGQAPELHHSRCLVHDRCPFGLVQMEVQVRATRTSLPQATQRYWVTRVGKRLTKPKPQPSPESDPESPK